MPQKKQNKSTNKLILLTNDSDIRQALIAELDKECANNPKEKIIEELGLQHGSIRIDVAVVNGIMHGYEIKSDRDTLIRLPEQIQTYNAIFDMVTLVVGSKHFVDAFKMIPDWWGIKTARINEEGIVFFNLIRKPKNNPTQHAVSIARLLWKQEAINKLENLGKADGVRSMPREVAYQRLAESIELRALKKHVRNVLLSPRHDWRSDAQQV
jgi:hypothetical protein